MWLFPGVSVLRCSRRWLLGPGLHENFPFWKILDAFGLVLMPVSIQVFSLSVAGGSVQATEV